MTIFDHQSDPPAQTALISIPLCTYNGACYLSTQLDSLFGQHYTAIEVIAIDDASTDNTVAILHDYASRYPNLRVLVNPENIGFRRNFALALEHCRGELVAPCDQDDIWLPEKLQQLYQCLGNASMSYCDSALISADGKLLGKATSDLWAMQSLDDPMRFVMENCVSGHAMLFRREVLTRALPIPDNFFHDWWLAAVAAAMGGAVFCPQALVHYRQHAANVTDVLRKRKRDVRTAEFKLSKWREIAGRISALATLAGPSRVPLLQLEKLWRARYRQWFCWTLLLYAIRYRNVLWSMKRRSFLQRCTLPFRYMTGLRWLGLFGSSNTETGRSLQ